MKKMEEMMELLTDEIEGFHKSIEKLEALSKNFKDLKLKADTSGIENYVKGLTRVQKKAINNFKEEATEIKQGLRSAQVTPNWLATLFCIVLSVQVLSLSYFGYHFIQFEERNKAAFLEGQKESIESTRRYFEDHPVIYEDYKKWTKRRDSVPNQK